MKKPIFGFVLGLIILPLIALVCFGIVNTFTNQIGGFNVYTGEPLTGPETICEGIDEKTSKRFTGFTTEKDQKACIDLGFDYKVYNFDSDINSDQKGSYTAEQYIIDLKEDEKIKIEELTPFGFVLVILTIIQYLSLLLIPITLIGSTILLLRHKSKKK